MATKQKERPSANGHSQDPETTVQNLVIETAASTADLKIPALELKTIILRIKGSSPLIVNAWSEKAKEMMRAKQQKMASKGRAVRNPQADFENSLYVIDPQKKIYGFPVIAFKAAAVSAALQLDQKKTQTRASFHLVNGITCPQGTLVPLEYEELRQREDMVRVGMGSADLRYRGEFIGWSCDLEVRYNARVISIEQVISLFNAAGFGIGVGEWRPEKDGMHGCFEVSEVFNKDDKR